MLVLFCRTTLADGSRPSAGGSQSATALVKIIKSLKNKQLTHYEQYSNHPIYPYLQYLDIKSDPEGVDDSAYQHILSKNLSTSIDKPIRSWWLERLAERKAWKAITQYYSKNSSTNTSKCLYYEAKLTLNPNDHGIIQEAKKHWLTGTTRPKKCKPLFTLLDRNHLNSDDYWERINLAMDKGGTSLAKYLAKQPQIKNKSTLHGLASLLIKSRKSPSTVISNSLLRDKTRYKTQQQDVIVYAMKRLGRYKPLTAIKQWQSGSLKSKLTQSQTTEVESYIGRILATDHDTKAINLINNIPHHLRSDDAFEWLVRLQIRESDWPGAIKSIINMPVSLRSKDRWIYWLAESYRQTGNNTKATNLYRTIHQDASFYGFLAADRTNSNYRTKFHQEKNYAAQTHHIKNIPDLKLATTLFDIGENKFASKVWFNVIKKLNKEQTLTAAAYAHSINQPFTAISTVSKTKEWNMIGLRFPVLYQNLLTKYSNKAKISPDWAYAITRRESAFAPEVISHANARGLMQILPSTAKGVAQKLGIKNHRKSHLLIPEKNIQLGTAYLSGLLDRFNGNYSLATASYNAGPHRMKKWAPKTTLSATQWIESIPFNETRKYVRAVLGYLIIYNHKLQPQSQLRISQLLNPIPVKKP